jgi:hypothetical protein
VREMKRGELEGEEITIWFLDSRKKPEKGKIC